MRRSTAILLPMLLAGQHSFAADQIVVPEGCKPLVTIMKNGCNASTVLDCGSFRETHTYTDGKVRVVHAYKSDWEMTEFRFADRGGAQMTAVPDTGSNMQIDTLLENGSIEEDGEFLLNTGVIENKKYYMTGRVELSGEEETYSGVPFKKGRIYRVFELQPNEGGLEFEIDVYISTDPDLIFEASWQRSIRGNNVETFDLTPQSLAWPGEDGFMADRSAFGCE